jgi:DNA-binding CsgD family transcriptional regulator
MEPPSEDAVACTARERQVLELLAEGLSNDEIAAALFLSPHTVVGYRKSLFVKLDVHTTVQAVVRGARLGLIALPGAGAGSPGGGPEASQPDG